MSFFASEMASSADFLLLMLIVVPLLMQLRRTAHEARVVRGLSAVVLGVGLALFVERVVFGV